MLLQWVIIRLPTRYREGICTSAGRPVWPFGPTVCLRQCCWENPLREQIQFSPRLTLDPARLASPYEACCVGEEIMASPACQVLRMSCRKLLGMRRTWLFFFFLPQGSFLFFLEVKKTDFSDRAWAQARWGQSRSCGFCDWAAISAAQWKVHSQRFWLRCRFVLILQKVTNPTNSVR